MVSWGRTTVLISSHKVLNYTTTFASISGRHSCPPQEDLSRIQTTRPAALWSGLTWCKTWSCLFEDGPQKCMVQAACALICSGNKWKRRKQRSQVKERSSTHGQQGSSLLQGLWEVCSSDGKIAACSSCSCRLNETRFRERRQRTEEKFEGGIPHQTLKWDSWYHSPVSPVYTWLLVITYDSVYFVVVSFLMQMKQSSTSCSSTWLGPAPSQTAMERL